MANALTALQRVAAGLEATIGTPVVATRLVPHLTGSSFTENETRQKLEEARGVLAYVDDVLTQRSSTLELQQELDWDLCLPVFLAGIAAAAPSGSGPFIYAFAANPLAPPAKATFTWEVVQSDGTTDHVTRRFGNARPTTIAIEFQQNGTTRLNSTWMGAAAAAVVKEAIALGTLSARRVVPAALWQVQVDDTWAKLGSAAAANVRALSWSLETGNAPAYHFRGRENFDMDAWYDGRLAGSLGITMDLDAEAAAEITHWRNGDLRFVRLGATNGEAGAALRSIQLDQAVRIIGSPNLLASDGEQATVAFDCELRADASGTTNQFLEVTVTSGLTGWVAATASVSTMAVPGNPRTLAVVPGDTDAVLTWVAPAAGGAVASYSVRHRAGTTGAWTETTAINALTHTLTGLTATTAYQVEVQAVNATGVSDWVRTTFTTTS